MERLRKKDKDEGVDERPPWTKGNAERSAAHSASVCRAKRSVSSAADPRIHSEGPPWTKGNAERSAAHSASVCRAKRSVSSAADPRIHSEGPPWTKGNAERSAAHSARRRA